MQPCYKHHPMAIMWDARMALSELFEMVKWNQDPRDNT